MSQLQAPDFVEVHGQADTVAAIERAVCARQNILFVGPPGVGATMLARRIPSILPEPTDRERVWIRAERDGSGLPCLDQLPARPFRAPHHTVSAAGLCGGYRGFRPTCGHDRHRGCLPPLRTPHAGEAQLARFGVLFLDEVAEFNTTALQHLAVVLKQMGRTAPLIVASALPCRCGWADSTLRACTCTPLMIERNAARVERARTILGLFARIEPTYVTLTELCGGGRPCEPSAAIQARVSAAWGVQS